MIMNITATQITPERKQELVEQLVDLLSSRYDAGDLYDILRHGLGMDHSDMEALGFQLRDYYEEVEQYGIRKSPQTVHGLSFDAKR